MNPPFCYPARNLPNHKRALCTCSTAEIRNSSRDLISQISIPARMNCGRFPFQGYNRGNNAPGRQLERMEDPLHVSEQLERLSGTTSTKNQPETNQTSRSRSPSIKSTRGASSALPRKASPFPGVVIVTVRHC